MAKIGNWSLLIAVFIAFAVFAERSAGNPITSSTDLISRIQIEQKVGVQKCGPYVVMMDDVVIAFHAKGIGVKYFNKNLVGLKVVVRMSIDSPSLTMYRVGGFVELVVAVPDMASAMELQPCLPPPDPDPRRFM